KKRPYFPQTNSHFWRKWYAFTTNWTSIPRAYRPSTIFWDKWRNFNKRWPHCEENWKGSNDSGTLWVLIYPILGIEQEFKTPQHDQFGLIASGKSSCNGP